ncbi:nucleotide exchange factor GrpE [Bacillus timonensis]|nr:nucleotide exchange factor GrpE [Bacillus timonensis]
MTLREVKQLANENQTTQEETIEQNVSTETETTNEETIEETVEKDELTLANEKINELQMKLDEAENRHFRLHADFENYKRRVRLDKEASEKYRAQNLVTDLLPALDNFERALKMEVTDEKTKSILQGMEMVYRSLTEALKNEGVDAIESVGQVFDPHLHQAVMQVEDSNFESNVVVEEFQKGYKLKDRVIRPAMVKVNQ